MATRVVERAGRFWSNLGGTTRVRDQVIRMRLLEPRQQSKMVIPSKGSASGTREGTSSSKDQGLGMAAKMVDKRAGHLSRGRTLVLTRVIPLIILPWEEPKRIVV